MSKSTRSTTWLARHRRFGESRRADLDAATAGVEAAGFAVKRAWASNLPALVAFANITGDYRGQIIAIFVIAITAAEVAIALAVLVVLMRNKETLEVDKVTILKG